LLVVGCWLLELELELELEHHFHFRFPKLPKDEG
jgi:hypothetical protein